MPTSSTNETSAWIHHTRTERQNRREPQSHYHKQHEHNVKLLAHYARKFKFKSELDPLVERLTVISLMIPMPKAVMVPAHPINIQWFGIIGMMCKGLLVAANDAWLFHQHARVDSTLNFLLRLGFNPALPRLHPLTIHTMSDDMTNST